jgi:Protein of unknown function (DUF1592)/Protein of unknown function (DUF1588)/Protein of unknown function (DUF1595)/Protein of unknown function (DUF1585)
VQNPLSGPSGANTVDAPGSASVASADVPPNSTPTGTDSNVSPPVAPPGTSPNETDPTASAPSDAPPPVGTPPGTSVTDPGSVPAAAEFAPAPGAFRRLTRSAFHNSLEDLFGGPVELGQVEPDSWAVGGLPVVSAAEVAISPRGVELYQTVIEDVVGQVFADEQRRSAVLECEPADDADTECFESFVSTFGRRAFRQPLTAAQLTRYTDLITEVAMLLGDPYEGMRAGMIGLLVSPNFLYRLEAGAPMATGESEHWQYTSHETASRLSYFLTNSTPDSELLDLADQDALRTVDQLRAQAERLLDSPAGRESVGNFASELYMLPLLETRAKDQTLFPEYTPELQAAMAGEVPAMLQSIVFDRGASALELFTTRSTFANDELAALYGLPSTNSPSAALSPVELPADGVRAGLLGTASFLSLFANQKEGSPTLRGKFVREVLLCQHIPDPPGDVSTVLPDPPPGVVYTKRERLEMHMADTACAGCHALLDPIGLTLENFDAVGKFRQTDNGKDIDVSGDLNNTAFNGPVELGQLLADMPETAACLATHMYRYGTGHMETSAERSTVLADLLAHFESNGHDLRDLMLEIASTDGFRLVAPPAP